MTSSLLCPGSGAFADNGMSRHTQACKTCGRLLAVTKGRVRPHTQPFQSDTTGNDAKDEPRERPLRPLPIADSED